MSRAWLRRDCTRVAGTRPEPLARSRHGPTTAPRPLSASTTTPSPASRCRGTGPAHAPRLTDARTHIMPSAPEHSVMETGKMTWDDLARDVGATPDDKGWLHVTRRRGAKPRTYGIQHVTIRDWQLALVQTTIARETQLGAAEAAVRLLPFPLGALVLNEGSGCCARRSRSKG